MIKSCQKMSDIAEIQQSVQYDTLDILGRGFYSKVYAGNFNKRQEEFQVAVKILNDEDNRRLKQKLSLQAQINQLKKLKFPNICRIYSNFYDQEDKLWIVMEKCDHTNLKQKLRQGRLPEATVFKYSYQLIAAVNYANQVSQIKMYQSLQLQNILIQNDNIKVGGFGMSNLFRVLDNRKFKEIIVSYPPEVLLKQNYYEKKCDSWCIGLIIYAMLTGEQLFQWRDEQRLIQDQKSKFQTKIKQKLAGIQNYSFWEDILINKLIVYDHQKRIQLSKLTQIFCNFNKSNERNVKIQKGIFPLKNVKFVKNADQNQVKRCKMLFQYKKQKILIYEKGLSILYHLVEDQTYILVQPRVQIMTLLMFRIQIQQIKDFLSMFEGNNFVLEGKKLNLCSNQKLEEQMKQYKKKMNKGLKRSQTEAQKLHKQLFQGKLHRLLQKQFGEKEPNLIQLLRNHETQPLGIKYCNELKMFLVKYCIPSYIKDFEEQNQHYCFTIILQIHFICQIEKIYPNKQPYNTIEMKTNFKSIDEMIPSQAKLKIQRIKNFKHIDKKIDRFPTNQFESNESYEQKYLVSKRIGPNKEVILYESQQLGRGNFGSVYKGVYLIKDKKQLVAVKKLHLTGQKLLAKNKNFTREMNILLELDNPYIIKCYFYHQDQKGNVYIVTQRCQPRDLGQQIQKSSFSSQRIFKFCYQITYAMKYMHQKGCIHRDIKPQNILITKEDNIKIADMGIAKIILKDNIQCLSAHTLTGTPIYSSPQIISQNKYSGKCDVWSTGCLFYEIITKKKLFTESTYLQLRRKQTMFRDSNWKEQNCLKSIEDPFWKDIINAMLTYDDNQERPTFEILLEKFHEQNKKKYNLNLQTERQLQKPIEQKKWDQSKIGQDKLIERKSKIRFTKVPERLSESPTKRPTSSSHIKIGPIRPITEQTKFMINKAKQQDRQKKIYDDAFIMIDFQYQKLKVTYKYIYQFQSVQDFPIDDFYFGILIFTLIFLHKMQIKEFKKEFGGNYIIFQGYQLTTKRNEDNQIFLNRINTNLNSLNQRFQKLDGYLKIYFDYIFQQKITTKIEKLEKDHPQLINILKNYAVLDLPSIQVAKIFKDCLKQYGVQFEQIKKQQPSNQLNSYRWIAFLYMLSDLQQAFPNTPPYIKDKIVSKFEEIQKMNKEALINFIS